MWLKWPACRPQSPTGPDRFSGIWNRHTGESRKKAPTVAQYGGSGIQLSMFQLDDPVLKQIRDEIKGLDINSLTPLEALNKLSEIKKIAGI